jgi:hypothetical protein
MYRLLQNNAKRAIKYSTQVIKKQAPACVQPYPISFAQHIRKPKQIWTLALAANGLPHDMDHSQKASKNLSIAWSHESLTRDT